MIELYSLYMQGFHQEVYDEILRRNDEISDRVLSLEVQRIFRETMYRVRSNIEVLLTRLSLLHYRFGEGFWSQLDDMSAEEKAAIEKDVPIFQAPVSDTVQKIKHLEHLVGSLPLSLKYWYEYVGCVNLVGLFASPERDTFSPEYGCILDPLFVYSLDMVIQMVENYRDDTAWENDSRLALSPDRFYKYGFSGSGAYSVQLPSSTFDVPLLLESHNTTFINYLRLCFRWGGFPGLEKDNRLTPEELSFLTKDLRLF